MLLTSPDCDFCWVTSERLNIVRYLYQTHRQHLLFIH